MSEKREVLAALRGGNWRGNAADVLPVNPIRGMGAAVKTIANINNLSYRFRPGESKKLERAQPGEGVAVHVPGSFLEAFDSGKVQSPKIVIYTEPKIEYEGDMRVTPITMREINEHYKLGKRKSRHQVKVYRVILPDGNKARFTISVGPNLTDDSFCVRTEIHMPFTNQLHSKISTSKRGWGDPVYKLITYRDGQTEIGLIDPTDSDTDPTVFTNFALHLRYLREASKTNRIVG